MEDDTDQSVTPTPATTGDNSQLFKGIGAAGAGFQAGGEIGQGLAALYAGNANARIAGFNAQIDRFKGLAADNRGIFIANQIGRQTGQKIAAQQTASAANGTVIGAGTNATEAAATTQVGFGDMATARNNALMAAWGFNSAAGGEEMRASLDKKAGEEAIIGDSAAAAGGLGTNLFRLSN